MNIYKIKVNIAQRVHEFFLIYIHKDLFVLDTGERFKSLQFLLSDHNSESTRKKLVLQAAEFNLSKCYECCQTRKDRKSSLV